MSTTSSRAAADTTTTDGVQLSSGPLSRDNRMFGDDLDRAVVLDVHDATAHSLAVRKVDEDVVAWSPGTLWLVHVVQDATA
jgi:hypothetical protein